MSFRKGSHHQTIIHTYTVATCKRRTPALVSKLRQSPQLYTNILKEQEKHGFIERVAVIDSSSLTC